MVVVATTLRDDPSGMIGEGDGEGAQGEGRYPQLVCRRPARGPYSTVRVRGDGEARGGGDVDALGA